MVGIRHGQLGDLGAKECVVADVDQGFGRSELTLNARVCKGVGINALDNTVFAHGNAVELGAAVEREIRNLHDGFGNHDVFKANISAECTFVNALELVIFCEVYGLQVLAVCKGVVVDRDYALGNIDRGDVLRFEERTVTKSQNVSVGIKLDFGQLGFFKRAKAQHFHACRNGQTTCSACGYHDQLSAVLGEQEAILGLIPRVVLVHRDLGQVRQGNKAVFPDVGHVCGDMQRGEARMVERVALQANVLCTAEGHTLQRGDFHECIVINIIDTVGQCDALQLGFCKGIFGNTLKRNSFFKGYRNKTAFLEHTSTHGGQRCGKRHFGQVAGALKGILLNGRNLRALGKGQRCYICIRKRFTADKGHTCGDGNLAKRVIGKRFCLNACQRIGQYHARNTLVLKRTTADGGDGRTEIKRGQINLGIASKIFDDGNVTRRKGCILIVALCLYTCHAHVVAANAVIPVLIQICGHGGSGQIKIQIACTKERKTSDMLYRSRQGQLGQRLTAIERVSAHVGHGFGQSQGRQALTETESKVINIGYLSIAPIDGGQLIHTLKAVCLHACQRTALLKGDCSQIGTAVEHVCRDTLQLAVLGKGHFS